MSLGERLAKLKKEAWSTQHLLGFAFGALGVSALSYRLFSKQVPLLVYDGPPAEPVWPFVFLVASGALLLFVTARLVDVVRVSRAPVLVIPSSPEEPARVCSRQKTVTVHVDPALRETEETVLTLLAYQLSDVDETPYRASLPKVTAGSVFRGPPSEARALLLETAAAWLGWAMFIAALASFGL